MSQIGHLRVRKAKNGDERFQMIVELWRDGKKYYKSKTCSSKKEAQDWGRKIHYEMSKGLVSKESLKNRKLSHAIDRYIAEVLPEKPRNARNVKQHLDWWKGEIGRLNLSEVSPGVIAEGRDKLLRETTHQGKKRAPATVVRYISSLSSVFETAVKEWQWTEKNPVRMIRKPSVSNSRTRYLTEEECKQLLACCKESRNPYLYSIVVLALSTGMRRGEILGLRWENINFDKKQITLEQTKNGSPRYIPLISVAFQVLNSLHENETILDPSYKVFPSLNLNRYLDIRTAWLFALQRAGIKGFTFHGLRHSCASYLGMSGSSQLDIANILGHKDLRMTFRYSHFSQEHLAQRLEKASEKTILQAAT